VKGEVVARRLAQWFQPGRPRPATVLAALALVISVGGNAAAAVIITSNNEVARNTISGHHPPAGGHANIIPGSLVGADVADNSLTTADIVESSLKGIAHKLYFSAATSSDPATRLARVGPWTIKATCSSPYLSLVVNGPGEAETGVGYASNDTGNRSLDSKVVTLANGTDVTIVADGAFNGFGRVWGTAMLRSGATVAQLDFNGVNDTNPEPDKCWLYGTASLGV